MVKRKPKQQSIIGIPYLYSKQHTGKEICNQHQWGDGHLPTKPEQKREPLEETDKRADLKLITLQRKTKKKNRQKTHNPKE